MGKKLFDYVIGNPPYNEDFDITILWMLPMKWQIKLN